MTIQRKQSAPTQQPAEVLRLEQPVDALLPFEERFAEGTRLYHDHYGSVVSVLKDSGGRFVYVQYDGTGCKQFVPRVALTYRERDQKKARKTSGGANIAGATPKAKKTPKPLTGEAALIKEQLSDYMAEHVTDREAVDKVAKKHGIEPPPADKPFGLAKMQIMNALRNMMKAGGKLK